MTIQALRKKYPKFIYRGYAYKHTRRDLTISFDFVVPALGGVEGPPNISFHPKVVIPNTPNIPKPYLDNLVFHLGLMEIPSYWKATCSPEIIVEVGFLNKEQVAWWKDLILKGMGEYFYQNKIDFTKPNFLKISCLTKRSLVLTKLRLVSNKNKALVPVGGGKDAAVTLELLKKAGMEVTPFLLNPKPEQIKILSLAKAGKPIVVERIIDPKLLELNRKGYLNGHTPFSAYLAFLTVLTAALFDHKYIALSNERSSNEGNVKYLGKTINHQYSKSFEFEKKFRQYSKKYLANNIEYFSFLRPLYELQIARIFAKYPKYFGAFLSCNEAHRTYSGTKKPLGRWCGACPKCLFVFLALYPFAGKKRTVTIFKKDLLKTKNYQLKTILSELTGKRNFKPFECVGTIEESKAALALSLGKIKDHKILRSWNTQHFLPPAFEKLLKRTVDK
ncbi:MAG: hypothetical protein HYW97_00075 [Candidatus Wildermuthbacteria bacterium]|nr:hypothetical protein [Candidatus Wildermuthbacteria bacterium]